MYKKIIVVTILSLSILGCKKDPGNVLPVDTLSDAVYPKSIADLQTLLVPGYSNFRTFALYGRQYLPLVLSNDHTFCSTSSGNFFGQSGADFLTNNIGITNNANAQLYSFLFQGVSKTNLFLDRAKYYVNAYGDSANVIPLRGQAYFLRGYYFYLLECFYGEKYIDMNQPEEPGVLGVPLPTSFATTFSEANLPRSSAYQVWSQIIQDFQNAANDLHGVSGLEKGRVTEWAAKGMLGKAYVFTKQYTKASETLLDVIQHSNKRLLQFSSEYKNAFNGNSAYEFNDESLFEINVDRQPGIENAIFSSKESNQSLTTDAGVTFGPTIISAGGLDGYGDKSCQNMTGGFNQYFLHDKNLKRFGFTIPPYKLISDPLHSDGPSTAKHPTLIMDQASRDYSLAVRANKTVDPRLFVCGLEPWVDSVRQTSVAKALADPERVPDTIPVGKAFIIAAPPDVRATVWGWSFKKYATIDDALQAYSFNDGANIYLLRLADIYLLYAEARMHIGGDNDQQGLFYLNEVHNRAYDGNPPSQYTSISNQSTLADPSDASLSHDPLAYERYVELFGEGGWFFDVCRWGIGPNEANYYGYGTTDYQPSSQSIVGAPIKTDAWTGTGTNIAAAHFPIPLVEIQANSGMRTAGQHNNYPY